MMYGQDRYRRRYWVLPHCGGVFIEAMESGEGSDNIIHIYTSLSHNYIEMHQLMYLVIKRQAFKANTSLL